MLRITAFGLGVVGQYHTAAARRLAIRSIPKKIQSSQWKGQKWGPFKRLSIGRAGISVEARHGLPGSVSSTHRRLHAVDARLTIVLNELDKVEVWGLEGAH